MGIKVYIPTPYRRFTGNQSRVDVEAATVGQLLQELERQFPGIGSQISDENGDIPGYLNVYVNTEEARTLQGKDTALTDGDEVSVIPAMAGGK
jgi:molybdopterin synthase sulfur carrier subunit